jgi:hypothetical protein
MKGRTLKRQRQQTPTPLEKAESKGRNKRGAKAGNKPTEESSSQDLHSLKKPVTQAMSLQGGQSKVEKRDLQV